MQKNLAARTALAVTLMCACAFAQGAKSKQLEMNFSNYTIVVTGGKEIRTHEEAKPGQTVEYVSDSKNLDKLPITNLKVWIPIPTWMVFVPGSPTPKDFEVSTDGKVYGAYPLKKMEKDASGGQHEVIVPDVQIRFVRWTIGKLEPGESKQVSTRARMVQLAPATPKK